MEFDIKDHPTYLKEKFLHYQKIFQKNITGDNVKTLSGMVGCSVTSMYSYLGGKVPKKAVILLFIEAGIKILDNLNIQYQKFEQKEENVKID